MKKTTLLATSLGLVGAFAATSSSAAIVFTPTQNQSFSLELGTTDSQVLLFDGFDATLGELKSIHLSFTATGSIVSEAVNINSTNPDIPATYGVPNLVTASYILTVEDTGSIVSASDFLQTPGATGTITFNDGTVTLGTDSGNLSDSAVLNDPPTDLSSFIGGVSAITFTIGGVANTSGSVNNPVFISNTASASGTVSLFYDYDDGREVPAPGVLALLGLGLVGMTYVRRRKAA
jgi:hypothetical protein